MIFVCITFLAAFLIEGLGTLVSVIGLSTLFGANPIIIALAIALDIGKLVVVTLLYSHWKRLNVVMKTYALIAATVTMVITSAGAAGYLAGEFSKAIVGTQESSLKVAVLKEEQTKLEARKKQIDDQIANLPANYSRSRVTLIKQFEDEQKQVTTRLNAISTELPVLQVKQIGVEAKAGPILYIAKAFDITVEQASKWVILMIIFVFDPLAVFLIISGNFLLHQRRIHKEESIAKADLFAEDSSEDVTSTEIDDDWEKFDGDYDAASWGEAWNEHTPPPVSETRAPVEDTITLASLKKAKEPVFRSTSLDGVKEDDGTVVSVDTMPTNNPALGSGVYTGNRPKG